MPIWWLIFMLGIVGAIVAGAVWETVQKRHSTSCPQVSAGAQIVAIDKRSSGKTIRRGMNVYVNLSRGYHVTFELLSDGKRKKFFIPVSGPERLAVGNIGMLTTQGTRYVSFEAE
ncbi:MAG: DUF2500 domain-containing protein [Oscillospiraceae bacterium]|nr:DUF2500 domain-containing protein [Oscillospiraceae bacterium]